MASPRDPLPTLRPGPRGTRARLGGDVTRWVFIVEDSHLLLLAGLPAHYQLSLQWTAVLILVFAAAIMFLIMVREGTP